MGERTPENSIAYVPSEDFTSYARAELSDALSEALFELYKGGPTRPSEAGDFLCDVFGSSGDAHPSMSNMRPPHRVKEEFVRYVEASGFPRQLHRAMALLHKSYVSGDMSRSGVSATAFVREKILAAKQRRHMARSGASYMGIDERHALVSDAAARHDGIATTGEQSAPRAERGDEIASSATQQDAAARKNEERGAKTNTPSIDDTARSLLFTSSDRPEKSSTELLDGETEPENEEDTTATSEPIKEEEDTPPEKEDTRVAEEAEEKPQDTDQQETADETQSSSATATAVIDADNEKNVEQEQDGEKEDLRAGKENSATAMEPTAEPGADVTEERTAVDSIATVDGVAAEGNEQPAIVAEAEPESGEVGEKDAPIASQ